MVRVLMIDDHQLFRDGLRAMFAAHDDLTIVGEAGDYRGAVDLLAHVESDLILLDLTLPGSGGLALLRERRRLRLRTPVLVLTMHQHGDMAVEAFASGANGYALKHQSEDELVEAMRATAARIRYLAPQLRGDLMHDVEEPETDYLPRAVLATLSSREREIFDLIVQGLSNQQIARQLYISVKTVETHRTHLMHKLDVHNVGELIRLAVRHGVLVS